MNNFRLQKIRHAPPRKPLNEKTKQNIATVLGIILLLLVLYWSGRSLFDQLSGTRIFEIVSGVFGKDLKTDTYDHTNILLLGVGGEGHEGKDLTDTIIVASLSDKTKKVSLLSLPRDLFAETSLGGSRVNRLYEKAKLKWDSQQGIDFVRQTLEDLLSVPIHYTVKVDFSAFEKAVDAVGGIDVYVEHTINDPEYPRDGTYEYETFFLPKGNQHLDGKTALKYVRSRKTSSDFDRSRRQQQVLLALKNKAQEENFFSRERLLKQLYTSLRDHVETTLSLRELLTLADFAAHWNSKNLSMATLNDEPIFRGGFLYTPLRELYGGAYVLLPAGDNFDMVRHFVKLAFYGPSNLNDFPLIILNGTEINGLAGKLKSILNRFGVNVAATGNSANQNLTKTTWYRRGPEHDELIGFLEKLIPGKRADLPQEYGANQKWADGKIFLEIGNESVELIEKLDIFRNIVPLVPPTTEQNNDKE